MILFGKKDLGLCFLLFFGKEAGITIFLLTFFGGGLTGGKTLFFQGPLGKKNLLGLIGWNFLLPLGKIIFHGKSLDLKDFYDFKELKAPLGVLRGGVEKTFWGKKFFWFLEGILLVFFFF